MARVDQVFVELIRGIIEDGEDITTRNSRVLRSTTQCISFRDTPLVSVRKTAWRLALREMEWFLSGSTDINKLHPSVQHWWKPWANERGHIACNYSKQFRNFGSKSFDQIEYLIEGISKHPNSRRNIATTWHSGEMASEDTPITNCHGTLIQFFVTGSGSLDMTMYQRSVDVMLGLPHNWIQYWAFLQWMAHRTGHKVGEFTWIGGDCHIYENHLIDTLKIVDARHRMEGLFCPDLIYNPSSEEFKADDFSLSFEYEPLFTTKLPMTV